MNLVKKLRDGVRREASGHSALWGSIMAEAADEIERLRAVRDAVIKHRDNEAFLNIDTWQACVARAEETLKGEDDE